MDLLNIPHGLILTLTMCSGFVGIYQITLVILLLLMVANNEDDAMELGLMALVIISIMLIYIIIYKYYYKQWNEMLITMQKKHKEVKSE